MVHSVGSTTAAQHSWHVQQRRPRRAAQVTAQVTPNKHSARPSLVTVRACVGRDLPSTRARGLSSRIGWLFGILASLAAFERHPEQTLARVAAARAGGKWADGHRP